MAKIPGLIKLIIIFAQLKNIIKREIKYGNMGATLKLTGFILLIIVILIALWFGYATLIAK